MSHFEYISVAIALINAAVVSKLLSGIATSLRPGSYYITHFAWVITLLLITIIQWWSFWGAREVEWTGFRFLWVLALPGSLYIRTTILLTEHPEQIDCFKEHYFASRNSFFSITLAAGVLIGLTPWVLGATPWFSVAPLHVGAASIIVFSIVGLVTQNELAHKLIVSIFMLSALANFFRVTY